MLKQDAGPVSSRSTQCEDCSKLRGRYKRNRCGSQYRKDLDDENRFIGDAAETLYGHAGTFRARRTFGHEMKRRCNGSIGVDGHVAVGFVACKTQTV